LPSRWEPRKLQSQDFSRLSPKTLRELQARTPIFRGFLSQFWCPIKHLFCGQFASTLYCYRISNIFFVCSAPGPFSPNYSRVECFQVHAAQRLRIESCKYSIRRSNELVEHCYDAPAVGECHCWQRRASDFGGHGDVRRYHGATR